jgi:hypothetical protein
VAIKADILRFGLHEPAWEATIDWGLKGGRTAGAPKSVAPKPAMN